MKVPRRGAGWYPPVAAPAAGDKTLYTFSEAAPFFRVQPRTLLKWVAQGRIPRHLVTVMGHRTKFMTGEQVRAALDLFAESTPQPAAVPRRRRRAA
jgi:hypothetical protein